MGLNIDPEGIYIDVTYGSGGHSKAILRRLTTGKLIVFDQDQESVKNKIIGDKRFTMINKNFKNLKLELKKLGGNTINGLIADLGVSSHHFSDNGRGFSFQYDARLDMRMDNNSQKDAVFILNQYDRKNLERIFFEHADFHNKRLITDKIIFARVKKPILTTFDLKEIFQGFVSSRNENKFFARLFQAIRIEVNDELNVLKSLLLQTLDLLSSSGRLVVISYHSLEDVLVKRFMKFGHFSNTPEKDFFGKVSTPFKVITKSPISPREEELKSNSRSRSAKLRICEKL